ncbi:MAG: TetR/AcrR family transcriptional regulator [Deltaproteobacteria bacterium]|nr:MAG: TetR/AcrR family transcriptional regulator [Deltaproteobacteria bacterium]
MEARKQPKQARSRATVEAILEATARVLVEDGYDALSTNRVAKVAGVSIGSLYQYFPNKESLVLAIVEQHTEEMMDMLRNAVTDLAHAPLDVAVRTYVRAIIEAHTVDPELHRALMMQVMHIGVELIGGINSTARQIVEGYLTLHLDELAITDVKTAAYVLVHAVEAVNHAHILEPDPPETEPLIEEVSQLVLRYLKG